MGKQVITDLLEQTIMGAALEYHLRHNHYPAVNLIFIPIAKQAIALGREGDFDTVLLMPNGLSKSVGDIVEGLHLDSFLDADNSDY